MEEFLNNLIAWATDFGLKLLAAIVVLIVGRILIKWVVKLMTKSKFAKKKKMKRKNSQTTKNNAAFQMKAAFFA